MKDIDFDELDRAVSSVLNQSKPAPSTTDDDAPKPAATTLTIDAEKTDDQPASVKSDDPDDTSEEASVPVSVEQPVKEKIPEPPVAQPVPSLATKRRGKFMDVMHPSHDMAPNKPAAAAVTAKPPRVMPLSNDIKPEPVTAPEASSAPDVAAEMTEEEESVIALPTTLPTEIPAHIPEDDPADDAKDSTYVDPIEFAKMQPSSDKAAVDTEEPVVAADDEPSDEDIQPSAVPSIEEPTLPVTPFLTDAKVEKRPLGGALAADDAVVEETTVGEPVEAPTDVQIAPTTPLPRELQPDVVRVETMADEDEEKLVEAKPDDAAKKGDADEVEGHPLFDASAYHEPSPAKKRAGMPGWAKWLFGLVLCLAAGGAIGYLMFMSGL